jgi:NAD(P)-dependent dehydrogenase (short-subunit alcohol dehydrogenase family)
MTSPETYPTIPDLSGKVVLITGASTGIGAAAAIAFGRKRRMWRSITTPARTRQGRLLKR